MKRSNLLAQGLALCLLGMGHRSAHAQGPLPGSFTPGPFSGGSLVVRVVGDGSTALSSAATKNFLLEYTTAGTTTNKIIILPSNLASANLTVSGTATSEGAVTLAGDGLTLLVTGYDAQTGTVSIANSSVSRVLGLINWQTGATDTTTRITDAYSGNNIRSAASADAASFWTAGASSSVRYIASVGAGSTTPIITSPSTVRYVNIFNGQLYATSMSGAFLGVFSIGTGLPATAGQTATVLSGFPTSGSSSPYDFYINPTADAIYVCDDRSKASGGGLQKWTKSGTTWSLAYTLNSGLTAGLRGLAFGGKDASNNNIFYAVGDTSSASVLAKVVDTGSASAFTVLATSGANELFRGVEILPAGGGGNVPDTSIASGPADSSTLCTNSATFTYTGTDSVTPTANLTYATRVDGGAFSAPTSSVTTTLNNLADGLHTFEVAAVNQANAVDPTPAKITFTVNTLSPVITNLTAVSITETGATITWNTGAPANSLVEYRVLGAATFTSTALQPAFVTAHSAPLLGLTANTTYEYRAHSTDSCGRETISGIQTFQTLITAPPPSKIRIAQWNVTQYPNMTAGGITRSDADFQTAIYGTFQGRAIAPDILIGEEFQTPASVTRFLGVLNTAPGSPGDWAASSWEAGTEFVPDTNSAFFYRASKVNFLGITLVAQGGASIADQPRNTYRYDISLKGFPMNAPIIACYGVHLKSGSTSDDIARRQIESQHIRDNSNVLPAAWYFLVGGDLNCQSSSQQPYQTLVGSTSDNTGRFFDPISTPGSWNNNSAYRFVHTQDPAQGSAGMDDRHDQILLSANLLDGTGLDYDGKYPMPYSTTTWNDPNHSFRAWGNDGTSFNQSLTITGNAMVGATIAAALSESALNGGHLPVFLDLKVPTPTAAVSGVITLESLAANALPQTITFVFHPSDNSGDLVLTAPINAVGAFTLSGLPLKNFTVHIKGAKWLAKNVAVNTTGGNVTGVTATLLGGDADNNNVADIGDFSILVNTYGDVYDPAGANPPASDVAADFNCDGSIDIADFSILVNNYGSSGE